MVDPQKRSSPNAIRITFSDGSKALEAEAEYPLGHSRRRAPALPMLEEKFRTSIAKSFRAERQKRIVEACFDQARFEKMTAPEFMQLFVG
jgi:2-methylcitrate dehydratase